LTVWVLDELLALPLAAHPVILSANKTRRGVANHFDRNLSLYIGSLLDT
jgi:hypothetical protein